LLNHEGPDEHEIEAFSFVPFASSWLKKICVVK
jgi:hypothetical protein